MSGPTTPGEPKYNATDAVTWYISVRPPAGKSEEWLSHEYRVVHAAMTRGIADHTDALQAYTQIGLVKPRDIQNAPNPNWRYLTCLKWQSLMAVWAGLQTEGYKQSAGSHVFASPDHEGCLAKEVVRYPSGEEVHTAIEAVLFHRRQTSSDEASDEWVQDQAQKAKETLDPDSPLKSYLLSVDVTPKDPNEYFAGSQFSTGDWLQYKAVEVLGFDDEDAAQDFLSGHLGAARQADANAALPVVVLGKATKVV